MAKVVFSGVRPGELRMFRVGDETVTYIVGFASSDPAGSEGTRKHFLSHDTSWSDVIMFRCGVPLLNSWPDDWIENDELISGGIDYDA